MKNITIIGASSFIGRHSLEQILSKNQYSIKVLAHATSNFPTTNNLEVVKGNLNKIETLKDLVVTGATVINFAYLKNSSPEDNITAIVNLAEVCKRERIKRLIHVSTAVVTGRTADNLITEETKCNPMNNYEKVKLVIENILIENYSDYFEVVVLRPTAVFGANGQNLLKLCNDILHGNKVINYMKSCLYYKRTMNLVAVHNVTAAVEHLLNAIDLNKEVFIISDDDNSMNNYRDLERYLMNVFKIKDYPIPIVPLPKWLLSKILAIMGKTNINPIVKYDTKKLTASGYRKKIDFEEALQRYTEWYNKLVK